MLGLPLTILDLSLLKILVVTSIKAIVSLEFALQVNASNAAKLLIFYLDSRSTPGTFFVSVQGMSNTAFYITWTAIDISATQNLVQTTTCNDAYSATHTCLENNQVVGGVCPEDETLYLYTYSFTGCQQISALLNVYGFGTDADLYGSFDPTNTAPYFGEADFSSYWVKTTNKTKS